MTKTFGKIGCLVTGVAGFVGSHLAQRLLEIGCDVVGVDNFFSGSLRNVLALRDHPRFYFYEESIDQPGLIARVKRDHPGLEVVFHLAAIVSVPYSMNHPDQTKKINYEATKELLADAERAGLRTFLFAGSAAEYGSDQRMPLKEEYADEKTHHLSPYGASKFLASKVVASSSIGIALRCFNIYGPRQDPGSPYSGVISRFIRQGLMGESLTIFGDGKQSRDFIYVSDVVDAYLVSADFGRVLRGPSAAIFNVGSGIPTSVLELASKVQSLTGNKKPFSFLPERAGDIGHSLADIGKFKSITRWVPRISLEEGLKDTGRWMKEELQSNPNENS